MHQCSYSLKSGEGLDIVVGHCIVSKNESILFEDSMDLSSAVECFSQTAQVAACHEYRGYFHFLSFAPNFFVSEGGSPFRLSRH